ncbi:MAG: type II toxin-antitoxin system VapC family toxin [Bacteroidota bacterium]|nr:type II toxin-antitoxin system VapC family toxin [Bacteroidota bacterium]
MKQKVYIETSVLSYLAARTSANKIVSAHQTVTKDWWRTESTKFELYVSEIVLREAGRGDVAAARKRFSYASECNILPMKNEVLSVAESFMKLSSMPKKASEDALHISVATVHHVDYLLSWNCAHIANASIQKELSKIAFSLGYELPILCTPLELFGE